MREGAFGSLVKPAVARLETASLRLGPRGSGFRFSRRGAWGTFGLPGRRYAWIRDVSVVPGREGAACGGGEARAAAGRPEPVDAAFRQGRERELVRQLQQGQDHRRESAAAAAAVMAQLDSMRHFWRDMPPVPTASELAEAELPQPFEFAEPPPRPPGPDEGRASLEDRIAAEERNGRAAPAGGPPIAVGVSLGLLAALATGSGPLLAALAGVLVGAAAWAAARVAADRLSRRRAAAAGRRRLEEEWRGHAERLAAAWRYAWAAWDLRRAQARVAWHAAELERIARVRRLRAGDPEASRACLEATLAELDLPYHATCELATRGDAAFLLVDLPDQDQVVPPVRAEVDEELTVTDVPLSAVERDEAYAEHVAGTSLLLARAAFAAVPALGRVRIAGYREGGASAVEYVVDVEVDRESAARIDPARVDPDAYLAVLPGHFQETESYRLAPIPPPAWLAEAFGTYALAATAVAWKN